MSNILTVYRVKEFLSVRTLGQIEQVLMSIGFGISEMKMGSAPDEGVVISVFCESNQFI